MPALVVGVSLLLASCSRGSDELAAPQSTVAATSSTNVSLAATVAPASASVPPESEASTEAAGGDETLVPIDPTAAPSSTIVVTQPTVTLADLPEIGVPGLDSTDAFCAAWSRFAGSFQVVAVTAAFGSGPPEQLASLEVAASPVVTEAYETLLANWPDELSSEADIVADQFLGPFARRLRVALDSLWGVEVDPAVADGIADAWLAGLARRDPSTPEFTVDLAPELWEIIDVAAADFAAQLVPFSSDPSLVTDVRTPLTDQYLATSCPDQGTLSGREVDAP